MWTGALLSSGLHEDLHVLPSLTDSFLEQHGFVYGGWSFFMLISEGRGGSAGAGARPGLLAFPRHLNSGSRDTPGVRSLRIPFLCEAVEEPPAVGPGDRVAVLCSCSP